METPFQYSGEVVSEVGPDAGLPEGLSSEREYLEAKKAYEEVRSTDWNSSTEGLFGFLGALRRYAAASREYSTDCERV